MDKRLELHEKLCEILGSRNVYFQPPEKLVMEHPCIVYKRIKPNVKFANNGLYFNKKAYSVITIDPDPDSDIPDKILSLPLCSFDRHYTSDNLNHDVYNLYY